MKTEVSLCFSNETFDSEDCFATFDPCTNRCLSGYEPYAFKRLNSHFSASTVYGIVYPPLVLITLITNMLIAIVLSKKHMRTPTNSVLKYMAYADMAVAVVPFPYMFLYHVLFGKHREKMHLERWWCYMAKYTTDAIPPLCHNIAIWLTVLLAVQRYMCIKYPLSGGRIWKLHLVRKLALLIAVIATVFSLPKFVDIFNFTVLKYEIYDPETLMIVHQYSICLYKPSQIVEHTGLAIFYSFYYWPRVILFVTVPSALLVIFSFLLAVEIRKVKKRKLLLNRRTREEDDGRSKYSTNGMLLVIVVIFLLVNLPQGLLLATFCLSQVFTSIQPDEDAIILATNIDNMLILATYPVNFAVYCCMSSSFRQTFENLCVKVYSRQAPLSERYATDVGPGTSVTIAKLLRRCEGKVEQSPSSALTQPNLETDTFL